MTVGTMPALAVSDEERRSRVIGRCVAMADVQR